MLKKLATLAVLAACGTVHAVSVNSMESISMGEKLELARAFAQENGCVGEQCLQEFIQILGKQDPSYLEAELAEENINLQYNSTNNTSIEQPPERCDW